MTIAMAADAAEPALEAEGTPFELHYPAPAGGTFDEMTDASGAFRPHWRPFMDALAGFTREEIASRSQRLATRVRDVGIAYDIFSEPHRSRQRWHVDLVPLIFGPVEWEWLERAMQQRARLFNAVLADIYGEQTLLKSGAIPPALVYSDPAFLRPCHGLQPPGGHLQFYAADIARGPDGNWRVIDSHTETPAGAGFALANRMVHTHVAGDVFAAANARRVAAFFQNFQAALVSRSGIADPRIALLTPGPHHEDYFGHAYLARYLGYLLVEGTDLVTSGQRVALKTLEGLKPIDLLVRCIEGHSADPLELDPSGFNGPAGLLEAVRKQPALVANGLGSAVAQNRGLGSFLPRVCKMLLGEDLLLQDASRLWLGETTERRRAIKRLQDVVIRKAQEGTGRPGRAEFGNDPALLSPAQRQRLAEDIELHGASLVAEEKIGFGTTPSLTVDGLKPEPFAVRLFVAASPQGFAVMPGGLAMTLDPSMAVALSAPDGRTRDVWVVSESAIEPHVSLWRPPIEIARVHRSQRALQSRVADDLFWLGRYAERCDWIMRVLRSALARLQEDSGLIASQGAARACLELLLPGGTKISPAARRAPDNVAIWDMSRQLIEARRGARTLDRTLDHLYRVASLVRDRLSFEAWQVLSLLRSGAAWRKALSHAETPGEVIDGIEQGLVSIAAFNGLMHENMTRNTGWTFIDLGRRLERANNLCEVTLALFGAPLGAVEETSRLLFLLELADSFITYRSRYRIDPVLALVFDLLLLDESNPRSVAFQLAALADELESLPLVDGKIGVPEERRIVMTLRATLRSADMEAMARDPDRARLQEILSEHLTLLPQLSNTIGRRYFSLTDDRPQRVHTRTEPRP